LSKVFAKVAAVDWLVVSAAIARVADLRERLFGFDAPYPQVSICVREGTMQGRHPQVRVVLTRRQRRLRPTWAQQRSANSKSRSRPPGV
jgi:hypothetical protein